MASRSTECPQPLCRQSQPLAHGPWGPAGAAHRRPEAHRLSPVPAPFCPARAGQCRCMRLETFSHVTGFFYAVMHVFFCHLLASGIRHLGRMRLIRMGACRNQLPATLAEETFSVFLSTFQIQAAFYRSFLSLPPSFNFDLHFGNPGQFFVGPGICIQDTQKIT